MSETFTTYGIGPDKCADELQALRDERDRLQLLVDYFRQRCEPFQHGGDHGWKVNGGILPAHIVAALTPAGGQNGQ